RRRKDDPIGFRAKSDVAAKKSSELQWSVGPQMPDFQLQRHQSAFCHFPAYPHQRDQPELYLMAIRETVHIHVVKRDGRGAIPAKLQTDPFVHDAAIARGLVKSVPKLL